MLSVLLGTVWSCEKIEPAATAAVKRMMCDFMFVEERRCLLVHVVVVCGDLKWRKSDSRRVLWLPSLTNRIVSMSTLVTITC